MAKLKKKEVNIKFSLGRVIALSVAAVFVLIVVPIGAFYIGELNRQSGRAEELIRMQNVLTIIRKNLYTKQNAGLFGGKTPSETIYLYYEFLESRDFPTISTYFVPENRSMELNRYALVSETDILRFVEDLRAAEIIARKADPAATEYKMTTPADFKMKKMSNGVWEFAYINYPFARTTE